MRKILLYGLYFCFVVLSSCAVFFLAHIFNGAGEIFCKAESGNILINEMYFPDAAFRTWLTNPLNLNGVGADGVFTQEELQSVTTIHIPENVNDMVQSLQGISYFVNLKKLIVPKHALVSLDVTQNTKLTYVNCSYNRLTQLHVQGLSLLQTLYCEFNYLQELQLSGLPNLTVLYCRHNLLKEISFAEATKLKFIETFDNALTEVDVSMLADLEFLHIDHNNLTRIDMSHNLKLQGGGFVVRNNDMREICLPNIPGFTIYYDDFAEQNPVAGYDRLNWYADEAYTIPITSDVEALGQTLYAKRIPNNYTIHFSAEGGVSAPSSLSAQYDTSLQLPMQTPSRKGYTFIGWTDNLWQPQTVYQPGEAVVNLGGKIHGTSVTLYAKWQPITYHIAFFGNSQDVVGEMPSISLFYGQTAVLPKNNFYREKYDFLGWAYTPQGKVVFKEAQEVYNLTDVENNTIALYAVWELNAEETRKPYVAQLDETLSLYVENNYVPQDWFLLQKYYASAQEQLVLAGKNTAKMQQIIRACQQNMASVLTKNLRIEEVVVGWQTEFQNVLYYVKNAPLPILEIHHIHACIERALERVILENLNIYSTLQENEHKTQILREARNVLNAQVSSLQVLQQVAQWMMQVQPLYILPLHQIYSSHQTQLGELWASLQRLSVEQQRFIPSGVTQALQERFFLATEKTTALQNLKNIMEKFTEPTYSAAQWKNIESIYHQSVLQIETSSTQESIQKLVLQAAKDIEKIPTLVQEERANALYKKQVFHTIFFIFLALRLTVVVCILFICILRKLKK